MKTKDNKKCDIKNRLDIRKSLNLVLIILSLNILLNMFFDINKIYAADMQQITNNISDSSISMLNFLLIILISLLIVLIFLAIAIILKLKKINIDELEKTLNSEKKLSSKLQINTNKADVSVNNKKDEKEYSNKKDEESVKDKSYEAEQKQEQNKNENKTIENRLEKSEYQKRFEEEILNKF